MAITRDGLYVATEVAIKTAVISVNLSSTTLKLAMFTDSLTPDFSAASPAYGSAPYNANEVTGAGYTAGGYTLLSNIFEELSGSPGTTRLDFANPAWTSSTITGAKGALVYLSAFSNRALILRNFGQAYATEDGTFTLNVHADGIYKLNQLGP